MTELYDGFMGLPGGMNSGTDQQLLDGSQYAVGINVVNNGGSISTRPGLQRLPLRFGNDYERLYFMSRIFQGCSPYYHNGKSFIVACVGGCLFVIDMHTMECDALGMRCGFMSKRARRVYFCLVADRYLVVQDGVSRPLVVDGYSFRRSETMSFDSPGIPTGTIMAYGYGRLFVLVGESFIAAGDILSTFDQESVLRFTEHNTVELGFYIAPPANMGKVTGMSFLQNVQAGTGLGPLVVMYERGMAAFNVATARQDWLNSEFGKVILSGAGCSSHYSIVPINNDLFFKSQDGPRSYRNSRLFDQLQLQGNVRLGYEMQPFFDRNTDWLDFSSFSAYFRNRLFMSLSQELFGCQSGLPVDDADVVSRAMAVMDFSPIAKLSASSSPVWQSLWTGTGFTGACVVSSNQMDRMVVFGKDAGGNAAYEVIDGSDDSGSPIVSRLVTRSHRFIESRGNSVDFAPKRLTGCELWVSGISGKTDFRVMVQTDRCGKWVSFPSRVVCSVVNDCDTPEGTTPNFSSQSRMPLVFGQPNDDHNPISTDFGMNSLLTGYEFQFMIEWEGRATITKARFTATGEARHLPSPCNDQCQTLDLCPVDLLDYRIVKVGGS